MFKKSAPSMEAHSSNEEITGSCSTTAIVNSLHADITPLEILLESPETTLAYGVSLRGKLQFEKLLRIDGFFEGEIESKGTLIVGPTGVVICDLNLEEAFISGKVKGNITVKKQLHLRGRAEVEGDICAPLLSVDEGVCLKGHLHITPSNSFSEEEEDHYSSDN